ncbi:hypothetical protein Q3W71_16745 [Micromonospora sp. C28SCA-DRY-2]|uniref:hypothetical protein n=1 Tax=Micromonospora sp. C28SCA-DRY-2 TaxID=3059522 RepID=UPI002677053A|nr:hypothetical protein [Micromonospora sp. C28SCA-DRY-2]MDO3703321.1 hypothetical protein [Micromonospora sp. C28SCA-DRY-2]
MNEYRKTLDEYVGDSPRTAIDIDDLVRRGRRGQRRRRLAVGSGALGLLAVSALLGASTLKPSTGGPAAATASASIAAADPAERLLRALTSAFAREAPNVGGFDTLQRQMHKCDTENPSSSQLVPYDAARLDQSCPGSPDSGGESYIWRGTLTSSAGVYDVRVDIIRTTHHEPEPAARPDNGTDAIMHRSPEAYSDRPQRGPNGEWILAKPYVLKMSKPDGTGIFIACHDPNAGPDSGTHGPFTAEQLIAVGLDPALRL